MNRWLKAVSDFLKKSESADHILIRSICISAAGIFLSIACLVSGTWAWFSASAENTVSKIRTASFEVVITDAEGREYNANSKGEYQLKAGTYYVTVAPSCGPAPAYCLVTVVETPSSRKLGKEIFTEYYADAEESWEFVTATDSNAFYEIEALGAATPSEASYEDEEYEYDFITMSVVKEGKYRYEWEAGTERSFELVLDTEATVTFEGLWKVASDSNAEVPDIEEMMQEQVFVFRYEVEIATPGNAVKEVAGQTGTVAAGSAAAAENGATVGDGATIGNGAAVENGTAVENGATVGDGAAIGNGAAVGNGGVVENGAPTDSGAADGNSNTIENSGATEGSDTAEDSGATEGSDTAEVPGAMEGSDTVEDSGATEESDTDENSGTVEAGDIVESSGATEESDTAENSGAAEGSDTAEDSGATEGSDTVENSETMGENDAIENSGATEESDTVEDSAAAEPVELTESSEIIGNDE